MWWLRLLGLLLFAPFQLWGVLSLYYGAGPAGLCLLLATLYGLGHFVLLFKAPKGRVFLACAAWFILLPLGAFFLARPSHQRDWQPDVARLPYVVFSNDTATVYNVRNCDYQSETNFVVRYETRVYDLDQLQSVDVFFSDWGLGDVAHTMLSFGFGSNDYLCLSVEARKEEGESYSALLGFFRRFELIGILADERDLIRLRTNYRDGETVYVYRLRVVSKEKARQQLLTFLEAINRLHARPRWYNALTANCMTSVFKVAQKSMDVKLSMWNWDVILNGHMPAWMYRGGAIDSTLPFEEMKQRSIVNARARAADSADDFSARIREGVPGLDWVLAEKEASKN